mmetsp:Transcript_40473/g.100671  ORF Transcript_40473/g.100671 Transcript_40473/m.100671 type:complete len:135 (-) Transcript_40473:186-590(-)
MLARSLLALALVLGASALQPLPAAAARRTVGARCVRSRLMAAATDSAPTDGASPLDDDIISLTDENGVNSLIGRKIETPGDWMEARMEYAKIDPELEALKNVTYDRSDWIKVFLVMVGSLYLGSSTRDPEEVAK